MSKTRQRTSVGRCQGLQAMVLATLLTGCAAGAPAPVQTQAAATHKTVLADFSERMLKLGAPAVLIEARVNDEVWSSAGGVRSLESRTPAEATDPVHVASVTKSLVAVSALKLVEEGAVRLGDDVGRHLPGFHSMMKPPGTVTVEQLLRHESGMPAYDDALFASQPVVEALIGTLAPDQGPALAATTPWVTMPGSGFQYSNSGYVVLGLMVQHVRGQALHQVLRTDIIEPLRLDGTQLMAPGPAPATMVHGYITMDGKRQDTTYHRGLIGNAAGGLVSTVGDVNTFYAALLEGRLLKPDTVKAMLLAPEGYGLGIWRWEDGCTDGFYYGHAGDLPGYGTLALSSPDARRQVTISITYPPEPATVSTDAPSNPLAWEIRRIARKALDTSCQPGHRSRQPRGIVAPEDFRP